MDRRVRNSVELARRQGVRVILGHPETPPPSLGWAPHLAETVDIVPAPAEEKKEESHGVVLQFRRK